MVDLLIFNPVSTLGKYLSYYCLKTKKYLNRVMTFSTYREKS